MQLDDQSNTALPQLPPRPADSHKGDFGRALVVGGSSGMAGAIALAGRATLRSGAGLVTLAVPRSIQHVVAAFEPSYMTHALAETNGSLAASATEELLELAAQASAVAIGPGLARGSELTNLVAALYRQVSLPMVVDADALFALAESPEALDSPGGVRILTPHPGEFARLTGSRPADTGRPAAAAALAARDSSQRTVVVLKGHRSVIADAQRYCLNATGNPGMATGGSGDVLTGVITGLLCQKLPPFDAARLATHIHGTAGDLARDALGEVSLIASDLLDYLPRAFQETIGR